jgi:hypothetical protein
MKFLATKELLVDINQISSPTKKRKDFSFHYLYIINTIRHSQIFDFTYTSESYIRLLSDLLGETISKQQTPIILKNLIKNNIIECDGVYIPGRKALGYRVSAHYLAQKWHYTDVTDAELVEKILGIKEKHANDIRSKGMGYVTAAYWAKEIVINKRNALFYINNKKNNFSDDQKAHFKISIDSVINKAFFTSCSKTNRMYHNLCCIKGGLRQHCTIDGQELFEIDITSSQPVFLGLLMRRNKNVNQDEVEKYIEVVCSGMFYEFIAKNAGLKINLKDKKIRSDFKQKFFTGCLYDVAREKLSKMELVFGKAFPTILAECRRIKQVDHCVLSQKLQKMEAKFIYHCVEICAKSIGNVPLTTIHDAIVSTEENIFMVEQIVIDEFKKLNITAKIKVEKL